MTWQRQESTSTCDSCRAYWNVLQDLGEEWDAAGRPEEPDGFGVLIGRALAAYSQHLVEHLPAKEAK
ncbi:hypothetical protein ACF09Y_22385 [Streptomyces massasporeus]|uniref:hypothetical protein n=1 Tax=Streptomyces massasporeus TaxID=67324 RepID=UPI0036FD7787